MKFTYNGVEFPISEITDFQRENVYSDDNVDLLYTRYRIGVLGHVGVGGNPVGLAASVDDALKPDYLGTATLPTARGTVPSGTLGAYIPGVFQDALQTDQTLRVRLMQPRKKLRITGIDTTGQERVFLESPRFSNYSDLTAQTRNVPGLTRGDQRHTKLTVATDATNGPTPLKCDIVEPAGECVSLSIHFMIETALVPCGSADEKLILSHRWQTVHTHDENNYLTRKILGTVVFNGSFLNLSGMSADFFRHQFFHPIPLGFERKLPILALSSDGLTVQYEVNDTDTAITFDPGDSGATAMQITEELNYLAPFDLNFRQMSEILRHDVSTYIPTR